ncbi:antitoxin DinJ [mine drainage metagenome]|uniref:Antitoxin DinJ n=1 Tax=mine drainage metagenome TaxID=410659 RepID=A0A1J5P7R7_9ZZZZ
MTAIANSFVRARVNKIMRDDAEAVLRDLGLTISEVMRMTLTRIAKDKAVPFELFVPNAATRQAMLEAEEIMATRRQRFANAQDMLNGLEKDSEDATV